MSDEAREDQCAMPETWLIHCWGYVLRKLSEGFVADTD